MGFGFDRQNVALLGLRELSNKEIYYTNQDTRSDFDEIVKNSFGENNNFKAYEEIVDAVATIGTDYMLQAKLVEKANVLASAIP